MTMWFRGFVLAEGIEEALPGAVEGANDSAVWVAPERWRDVAAHLKDTEAWDFEYLNAITAVDYIEYFEVIYHLTSLRHNHAGVVKVKCWGRDEPSLPSVADLWKGANLQEREIYDLMDPAVHRYFRKLPDQGHLLHRGEVTCVQLVEVDPGTNSFPVLVQPVPDRPVVPRRKMLSVEQGSHRLPGGVVDGQLDRGLLSQVEAYGRFRVEGIGEILAQCIDRGNPVQLDNGVAEEYGEHLRAAGGAVEVDLLQVVVKDGSGRRVRIEELVAREDIDRALARNHVADALINGVVGAPETSQPRLLVCETTPHLRRTSRSPVTSPAKLANSAGTGMSQVMLNSTLRSTCSSIEFGALVVAVTPTEVLPDSMPPSQSRVMEARPSESVELTTTTSAVPAVIAIGSPPTRYTDSAPLLVIVQVISCPSPAASSASVKLTPRVASPTLPSSIPVSSRAGEKSRLRSVAPTAVKAGSLTGGLTMIEMPIAPASNSSRCVDEGPREIMVTVMVASVASVNESAAVSTQVAEGAIPVEGPGEVRRPSLTWPPPFSQPGGNEVGSRREGGCFQIEGVCGGHSIVMSN